MTNVLIPPVYRSVFCGSARRQGPEGASCRRPAGWGTDHVGIGRCKLHGGCTPTHENAVATRMAAKTQALFGAPREDVDPIEGLLEELQRSAGLIDSYEAMCAQLLPDDVVYGVVSQEESRTTDPTTSEGSADLAPVEVKTRRAPAVNIWVKLLDKERDRFTKLCETMIKLDLESRRISLEHGHVAILVQMLLSEDLALTVDQKRSAARMLRTLDPDGPKVIEAQVIA